MADGQLVAEPVQTAEEALARRGAVQAVLAAVRDAVRAAPSPAAQAVRTRTETGVRRHALTGRAMD
jgi:hypothetical protein